MVHGINTERVDEHRAHFEQQPQDEVDSERKNGRIPTEGRSPCDVGQGAVKHHEALEACVVPPRHARCLDANRTADGLGQRRDGVVKQDFLVRIVPFWLVVQAQPFVQHGAHDVEAVVRLPAAGVLQGDLVELGLLQNAARHESRPLLRRRFEPVIAEFRLGRPREDDHEVGEAAEQLLVFDRSTRLLHHVDRRVDELTPEFA